MATALPPLDVARCEALAARAASGDGDASRELVALLWPHWKRLVAGSRAMRCAGEDAVHDVVAGLVEKIGKPRSRELSLYPVWRERNRDKTFEDWMRIVVANATRDRARAELGRGARGDDAPSPKSVLNALAAAFDADDVGVRPPFTTVQTAREVLEFAARRLPPDQHRVLAEWLASGSLAEVARALGLADEDAARRALRAAIAVLRRKFAGDATSA